MFALSEYT